MKIDKDLPRQTGSIDNGVGLCVSDIYIPGPTKKLWGRNILLLIPTLTLIEEFPPLACLSIALHSDCY